MSFYTGEEGEDLDGWLYQVDHYFILNQLTERDKMEAVLLYLKDI